MAAKNLRNLVCMVVHANNQGTATTTQVLPSTTIIFPRKPNCGSCVPECYSWSSPYILKIGTRSPETGIEDYFPIANAQSQLSSSGKPCSCRNKVLKPLVKPSLQVPILQLPFLYNQTDLTEIILMHASASYYSLQYNFVSNNLLQIRTSLSVLLNPVILLHCMRLR